MFSFVVRRVLCHRVAGAASAAALAAASRLVPRAVAALAHSAHVPFNRMNFRCLFAAFFCVFD
jgi:hypothetical protein